MSDLTDLLHRLAAAVHRPADHPQAELDAAINELEEAPGTAASPASPAPSPEPSDPDTPAPAFGSESAPEGASFPVQPGPSA